jgi:hypothetical protein
VVKKILIATTLYSLAIPAFCREAAKVSSGAKLSPKMDTPSRHEFEAHFGAPVVPIVAYWGYGYTFRIQGPLRLLGSFNKAGVKTHYVQSKRIGMRWDGDRQYFADLGYGLSTRYSMDSDENGNLQTATHSTKGLYLAFGRHLSIDEDFKLSIRILALDFNNQIEAISGELVSFNFLFKI